MPLTPGQILRERYRIDELLGQGGFGAVYRAWDLSLDGPVALKESLETSPAAQKQFELEARLLFKLRHPNLPRVTDHFSLPDQGQYLVMDYVEGQDLDDLLDSSGRPLPPDQVLPWILQVCDALAYLHAQNPPIIHRDIKPANIRITPQGQAVLVDFGIAKLFDPAQRTTTGARAVTLNYSPPEQFGMGATDARSDVYALGATLYHILTGQPPAPAVDLLAGVSPPARPAHQTNPLVPAHISQAIEVAMRPNRSERWASVAELRAALAAAGPAIVQITPPAIAPAAGYVAPQSDAPPAAASQPASPTVLPEAGPAQVAVKARRRRGLRWYLGMGVLLLVSACCTLFGIGIIGSMLEGNAPADVPTFRPLPVEGPFATRQATAPAQATAAVTPPGTTATRHATIPSQATRQDPAIASPAGAPDGFEPMPQALPTGGDPLTPANASQIAELALWGKGNITGLNLAPGAQELVAAGSIGVFAYAAQDLSPLGWQLSYGWANDAAVSPDGSLIAAGTWANIVQIFDARNGSELARLEDALDGVMSVAFSPDGKLLAGGSYDDNIYIWDLQDRQLVHTLKGHDAPVTDVIFSPDGSRLASASEDNQVRIWDVASGEKVTVLSGHTAPVMVLAFSPDGALLASAGRDAAARLWDTASWNENQVLQGHTDDILGLAFSPDGTMLATGSDDHSIRLWNSIDGKQTGVIDEGAEVNSLAVLPGDQLAVISNSMDLHLRRIPDGELLAERSEHTPEGRGLAVSADGQQIVSAWADWQIRQLSAQDGGLQSSWAGHTDSVNAVAISPDQQWAASGADDGEVILWAPGGIPARQFAAHSGAVRSLAFSPDNAQLVSTGDDGQVVVWPVGGDDPLLKIDAHPGGALSAIFSPDGSLLATAGQDSAIRIWDATTGELHSALEGHTRAVTGLAYSPDGGLLVSGSLDGRLGLWQVEDGKRLDWLPADNTAVTGVAISPDGSLVAAALDNASLAIWSLESKEMLAYVGSHTGPVTGLVFAPGGEYIYTISVDGTLRVWGVQP